jgi:hypothetical protein
MLQLTTVINGEDTEDWNANCPICPHILHKQNCLTQQQDSKLSCPYKTHEGITHTTFHTKEF